MPQFLLNFHHFPIPKDAAPDPDQINAVIKQWQHYIGSIAGQGKFIGTQRLDQSGTVIGPDGKLSSAVSDGKGLIVGTLTLEAADLEEALSLSRDCPVLSMGGSVEVRPVLTFEM